MADPQENPFARFAKEDEQTPEESNPFAQFAAQEPVAPNPFAQFAPQEPVEPATNPDEDRGFFKQLFSKGIPAAASSMALVPQKVDLQIDSDRVVRERGLQDAYKRIDAGETAEDIFYELISENKYLDLGRLQAYEYSDPNYRQEIVSQSNETIQESSQDIAQTAPELAAKQQNIAEKYGARVGELTDIRDLADFRDWLGYNVGSGLVNIGPVMVAGAVAGPYGAGAVGTGLALGETIDTRLGYILDLTSNLNEEDRTQAIIEYLNKTGDVTTLTALASGTLDVIAGPVGSLLRRKAARELGEEVVKRSTAQAAKETLKEAPRELVEEGITGGLQETAQIIGERVLGEQVGDAITVENFKRIVNSAAAEAAGGLSGSGINVATESGRQFFRNRVEELIKEQAENIARQEQVAGSQDEIQTTFEDDVAYYVRQGMTEEEATLLAAKGQSYSTGRQEDTQEDELDQLDLNLDSDIAQGEVQDQEAVDEDAQLADAVEREATEETPVDDNYNKAVEFVKSRPSVTTSELQRFLGIGFNPTREIIDRLQQNQLLDAEVATDDSVSYPVKKETATAQQPPTEDMVGFEGVQQSSQVDYGFEPTRQRLLNELNQLPTARLDEALKEAKLQVSGTREEKIERMISAREAWEVLSNKEYKSIQDIEEAIKNGEIGTADAARWASAASTTQQGAVNEIATGTNASRIAGLINKLSKGRISYPFRTEAQELAFQEEYNKRPDVVELRKQKETTAARNDRVNAWMNNPDNRKQVVDFWANATPEERGQLLDAVGVAGNTDRKRKTRANKANLDEVPYEVQAGLALWAPDNWSDWYSGYKANTGKAPIKQDQVADAQVPSGRQELFDTPEQVQEEQNKRAAAKQESKYKAGQDYDKRKSILTKLRNVVEGKQVAKIRNKYIKKGLTEENLRTIETAIQSFGEGGVRPAGDIIAERSDRKTANQQITLFNEYANELETTKKQRIQAIADALRLVENFADRRTKAAQEINQLLNDRKLRAEDIAEAEKLNQQRDLQRKTGPRFIVTSALPLSKVEDYQQPNEGMRNATGDVSLAIKAILADPDTPSYIKAMVKKLEPALKGVEVFVVSDQEQIWSTDMGLDVAGNIALIEGAVLGIQEITVNPDGSIRNVIVLNDLGNSEGSGISSIIVAHEMIHAATTSIMHAYEQDPNSVSPGTRKAIKQLESLYVSANQRVLDKQKNGLLSEAQIEIFERAFENLDEFVAYGLTDPTVQEFLLDMPPETSWAEGQSWNGLSLFTKLIRKVLGIIEGQVSAFDNLVDLTGRLVDFNTKQKNNRPPSSAINYAKSKTERNSALKENLRKSNDAAGTYRNVWQMVKGTRSLKDAIDTLDALYDSINAKSLRLIISGWTTDGITRFARNRIANIASVNKIIEDMAVYRGRILRELYEQVPEWEDFIAKFPKGSEVLSDVMHIATLNGIDPSRFGSLQETLAKDPLLAHYRSQLANPSTTPQEAAKFRGKITARTNKIRETFTAWEWLQMADNGGQRGVKIYKMAKKAYEKSHKLHMKLLLGNIRESKLPDQRKQDLIDRILNPAKHAVDKAREKNNQIDAAIAADPAMAAELLPQKQNIPEIVATYQAHNTLAVYFPLMRYGDFFLSVGKGRGREFYMFESESARNKFARKLAKDRANPASGKFESYENWIEAGQMQIGDNKNNDQLRQEAENSSEDLKNIFQMMSDPSLINTKDLQDQVYQLYLKTLPGGDLRRKFIHRSGIAGYSRDTLRNFASSQHNSANQLARLRYGKQLRLAMASMYAELKNNPDQVKLRVVADEISKRAMAEIKPPTPSSLDSVASLGNKVVFLWMMSGIKSALVQSTQLAIVGTPVLMARFGGVDVTKTMANYSIGALNGKVSLTRRKANGELVTEWGQPSIRYSKYVTENGEYGNALARAWEFANERGFFMDTYAKDINDITGSASDQKMSLPSRSSKIVMGAMTGAFHHMERINREIMYMSSFELGYNERLKQGMDKEQAAREAMNEAMKLAYEGLFNYTNYNKPRLFKNPVGRLAFQFMTFPLQMTSYLYRNFIGQIPLLNEQGKKEAAAKFWGTLGMTWLFAGSVGMPLYGIFAAAVDGIRESMRPELCEELGICPGDPDYEDKIDPTNILGPVSFDLWFRTVFLPSMFGPDSSFAKALGLTEEQAYLAARIAEMGPISALTDLNVGASTSLDMLWFRDDVPAANLETAFQELVFKTALGPTAGLIGNATRAAEAFGREDYNKAVEDLLPALFKNVARAVRFEDEGLISNNGTIINPKEYYSTYRLFGQTIGFQDTTTAQLQRTNFLAREFENDVEGRRAETLAAYARADLEFERNPTEDNLAKLNQREVDIDNFNYQFPFFVITQETLKSSLEGRAESRAIAEEEGGLLIQSVGVKDFLQPLLEPTRAYGGKSTQGTLKTLLPDED